MQYIFKRLNELLSKSRESRYIITDDIKLNIDKELFKRLSPVSSGSSLVFIDGGNGEIAKASDFSLHFARIAFVHYKGNKRIHSSVKECFIMANSIIENNVLFFQVDCLDVKQGDIFGSFKINARDSSLTTGNKPIEPHVAVLHVRKLLELKLMLDLAKKFDYDDVLVRDGDFEDGPFVQDILSQLKLKNPVILGISKTSTILTDSGDAAVEVLSKIGGKGPWVYADAHLVCFAKFNASSEYVFKIDFIKEKNIPALNKLAGMSSDPVFLGYPYGLVAVDALARVNSSWVDVYKALFESIVGVSQFSKDAHDILNKIS